MEHMDMVFEVVHQYLEVLFWLFDVVALLHGTHPKNKQKHKATWAFRTYFFAAANPVRFVSVQKSEAVKVRLLHYIIMSGNCTSTSFRVHERRNFFILKNSVKQLKLEGVYNACPTDHIAKKG